MRLIFTLLLTLAASQAQAFCGFYVAHADGKLYNKASKVVFVRNGEKSVITMASDYRGAASEFAMVVPTLVMLKRKQINTVEAAMVDHLDAYTAPRLVEYWDDDPCAPEIMFAAPEPAIVEEAPAPSARSLGVKAFRL